MKVVTIIGARPQFIKAAMVCRELANHDDVKEVILHTGQHFDDNMSKVFFNEMGIPIPDYELGIHSLNHGAMIGRMLESIERILLDEKPDMVLVYGDTNSTLAGSLSAAKLNMPVAHVEAGLRSHNMEMPEEINRILTDRISTLLFCPTDRAVMNLEAEGFDKESRTIIKCGDVMFDAALCFSRAGATRSTFLRDLDLENSPYVLCTIHRPENTDSPDRLRPIIDALGIINSEIRVVFPLHPRTRNSLEHHGIDSEFEHIAPVSYLEMLVLLENCRLVLTDSGGLQKEAFFFRKHCVTFRNETEWTELVDNGFNSLVGADTGRILASYNEMLNRSSNFDIDLYGNGFTRRIIVDELVKQ